MFKLLLKKEGVVDTTPWSECHAPTSSKL